MELAFVDLGEVVLAEEFRHRVAEEGFSRGRLGGPKHDGGVEFYPRVLELIREPGFEPIAMGRVGGEDVVEVGEPEGTVTEDGFYGRGNPGVEHVGVELGLTWGVGHTPNLAAIAAGHPDRSDILAFDDAVGADGLDEFATGIDVEFGFGWGRDDDDPREAFDETEFLIHRVERGFHRLGKFDDGGRLALGFCGWYAFHTDWHPFGLWEWRLSAWRLGVFFALRLG